VDFAQKLRNLREDMEPPVTQTQLGSLLNMGQSKISRLESGEFEPNLQELYDICKALHVSSDYLLGLTDNPRPYQSK